MNFDLTDEQKMIRDMARDFAREVIAPRAEEMEATGEYPYDVIEKMAGSLLRRWRKRRQATRIRSTAGTDSWKNTLFHASTGARRYFRS
jgi:alkylation response protein AidB-like acyl-CoA dehydrogenase